MQGCGACCYLETSERPELENYLSPEELKQYQGLVGEDGWCIHYQKDTQTCGIYDHRPSFCRVSAENFKWRFGVNEEEFDEFAIACCCDHIADRYGEDSEEMNRYLNLVDEEINLVYSPS
ncbi:MAG: YkgJ family cysteine cluster protein [Halothece sp.]